MLAVSNTSPIMNLASVGGLDLLRQQFEEVVVPAAVVDELKLNADYPGTSEIRAAMTTGWLKQITWKTTSWQKHYGLNWMTERPKPLRWLFN